MASAVRTHRIRRLVVGGAAVVLLASGGAGVAHAAGFLGLSPDEGAPGTPYKVTITCDQEPTLYGQPLDNNPRGTLAPLSIAPDGATQWTFDATAGNYDDSYGARCGDETAGARFDTDAPWLYLGPLGVRAPDFGRPKTEVAGTDCPAGTTASVSITRNGTTTSHTASIDQYGDWNVPLDTPYMMSGAIESLRVEASCGNVTYAPLVREPAETTTSSSSLPTDSTATTATTAPGAAATRPAAANPAHARPARASYTG